jgi:hypothetical protein
LIADGEPREVLARQRVKELFLGTETTVADPAPHGLLVPDQPKSDA